MLLKREYINVDQPLDGVLEVVFPAETGVRFGKDHTPLAEPKMPRPK
jgi:hypothetical protein